VNRPIIEFLDPDGSYALVQPFDEVRGRVLSSNVFEKGSVLHKSEELCWTEAAEDLGGFTRLGPADLLSPGEDGPAPVWEESELLGMLEEQMGPGRAEPGGDPGPQAISPAPGYDRGAPGDEEDPVGFLLGLVGHIRQLHEKRGRGPRGVTPCRCLAFRVNDDRLRTRLRQRIASALQKERLPRLTRILVSLRESLGSCLGAA
jgi:hypothetical protein